MEKYHKTLIGLRSDSDSQELLDLWNSFKCQSKNLEIMNKPHLILNDIIANSS